MGVKFGPGGLGSAKEAISNLERYKELGLKACEVEFTYGVYMKKYFAVEIGKIAKKLGIELSVHAPYWINLNSAESEKIEASKKRILKSAEIADALGARNVVFHCGFYGKDDKGVCFDNIKSAVIEMLEVAKKERWDVVLCPETMGKKNVFGSVDEIARLVEETGCGFCIDFAHVLARYGKHQFELLEKSFKQKKWHCHFSGIEYGEKGEKKHIDTTPQHWRSLFKRLPKGKDIVIISEAPRPVADAVEGFAIWSELNKK